MSQDGVNETSMNFDIDAESDRDSDTEPTFSSISKLEPYCFEPKKSNASIEDSFESEEEPTENLTQGIDNKDWWRCGNCRAMETSEESICCQDQKEVLEENFEAYQTKPSNQRGLKKHNAALHYDCNNIIAMLLQHHNAVALSEAVMNFLKNR